MENIYDPSYYRILCVGTTATAAEIKAAWRGQMKVFHEDLNQNDAGAKEKSQKLNEAYAELSNPEKRKQYDSNLNAYIRKQEEKQRAQAESKQKGPSATHWNVSTPFATRSADSGMGIFGLILVFILLAAIAFGNSKNNELSDGKK